MSIANVLGRTARILSHVFVIGLSLLALSGAWSTLGGIRQALEVSIGETLFLVLFGGGLALFWTPLAWLVMSRVTPKSLEDRYLKEPHFTIPEIIGRSVISPLIPFPTTMFMVACTLPRTWLASRWLGRRQMADLRDYAPAWFVWCSRIIYVGAAVHFLLLVGLFIGLSIYLNANPG